MMHVLKSERQADGLPVWIFVDKIVLITANEQGNAVVHTVDGERHALAYSAGEALNTIVKMANS